MRVCVITSSYPRFEQDGNARFVRSIAEAQVKLGHEVCVVAPYAPEVRPYPSTAQLNWFRYVSPARFHIMGHARSLRSDTRFDPLVFFLLPLFLLSAFITLLRVTQKQKTDVIHAHWVLPSGLIAAWVAALRRIPFVVSLHGSDIFVARRSRIIGWIARFVFCRAAAVTACSPDLREAAISLGAPQETRLLAWGADPILFHPTRDLVASRRALGWDRSEIVVVALGRMVPKKGFSILLEAMPLVIEGYPQTRLVLGGDGPLREELFHQAKALGLSEHVSFANRISWDQVPGFLAAADIFVLPSIRDECGNVDGLPTVLLEAMSCGIPVIASDIGGVSLVVEDGKTGRLVPAGDVRALSNAILCLVGDKEARRKMGQAARRAVEEQYNWQNVARQLTELMEQGIVAGVK